MFRGTLRYQGYCELMGAFKEVGLLGMDVQKDLDSMSWVIYYCFLLIKGVLGSIDDAIIEG